jgi:hypothetical protein
MNEVVINYQLTWPEFRKMQWIVAPKRNLVLVLVIVTFSAILAVAGSDIQWTIAAIIFGLGFPAMFFWISPKMNWNNSLDAKDPRTTTVDEAGIVNRSTTRELKLAWSQIDAVKENARYFIAFPVKGHGALFMPKRGLRSSDDETMLRTLLQTHVGSLPQS